MRSFDESMFSFADPPNDSGSGLPIPPAGSLNGPDSVGDGSDEEVFAGGVDQVARQDQIKKNAEMSEETKEPRYLFARVCVVIIMVMWVWVGFIKVTDMSKFVETVDTHRVLPDHLKDLLWWVGPGELVLGLMLVFVIGSELRKPFGKLVLMVSGLTIIGFMYYLSLVDPVVLMESGCGCFGDYRIASGIEGAERIAHYGLSTILLLLHLGALFGPAMVDSRRRS